MLCKDSTIQ